MAPSSDRETQLNEYGVQLQAFSYPMALKAFTYSNAFMAKWRSQSLSFKSMMDKKKEIENKHRTNPSLPLRLEAKSQRHHIRHGDRRGPYHSCTSDTFSRST